MTEPDLGDYVARGALLVVLPALALTLVGGWVWCWIQTMRGKYPPPAGDDGLIAVCMIGPFVLGLFALVGWLTS